jgi:NADH-quinone oxidoreductase subunit N
MEIIYLMKHELLLVLLLVVLLIAKILEDGQNNNSVIRLFNGLMFLNFLGGWFFNSYGSVFGNMFSSNELLVFEKNILNAGVLLIGLSSTEWLKKQKHLAEYYILMISALLGMFLMISSQNFLMFYLGIELAAIPVAAICNFNQDERRSSEAAMKMIFSSAFSSSLMLLGISFLYGAGGALGFSEMAIIPVSGLYLGGFVLFLTGLIFKLSVVPFHFWTADVYEGSPVSVTSFLSVISKGAMVFVLASVLHRVFPALQSEWYFLICILSVLTMVTGNLFALRQQNMKRFLAFSSITQVGFILIGISGDFISGATSSVYFIVIYVFSNLAAFAVVSIISEQTGKETISQYKGLARTNPTLAWVLAIALFSLAGIPPTAGFFGKIFLLTAGASTGNYLLISIAALNMIVSLYYYLRVIRAMFMDENTEPIQKLEINLASKVSILICIAGILLIGFFGIIYEYIHSLASGI